jgi:hypothetical protein
VRPQARKNARHIVSLVRGATAADIESYFVDRPLDAERMKRQARDRRESSPVSVPDETLVTSAATCAYYWNGSKDNVCTARRSA